MDKSERTNWNFLILVILLLVFLAPFGLANLFYYFHETPTWQTTPINYGTIIRPPLQLRSLPLLDTHGKNLPSNALRGKWLFVYIVNDTCDNHCQKNLYFMQQLRIATGVTNQYRFRRLLITTNKKILPALSQKIAHDYPGMLILSTTKTALSANKHGLEINNLYLTDPLGNVIISYPSLKDANKILKDLERLLMVSHIG